MQIRSIRTHKIKPPLSLRASRRSNPGNLRLPREYPRNDRLLDLLNRYIKKPDDGSVLAITSKIVSICEGSIVPCHPERSEGSNVKLSLIKKYSQFYLEPSNPYNISLTITNNILIPSAGIDESNANGFYILWPRDAQKTANEIRAYFSKKFGLRHFGVVITDSKTTPLRWGTTGFALAHSGFNALNNYIGKSDIFGRKLKVTKSSIMNGLASAAVLAMGEGKEQTPLALISDLPFVQFQKRNPTPAELRGLKISIKKDLYAPLLKNAPWKRGNSRN